MRLKKHRSASNSAGNAVMRLHAFMDCSLVNGPGRRAVVWLQGCELGCAQCWNPATHAQNAGVLISPFKLTSRIEQACHLHSLEGVTLSGGEPIHQVQEVIELFLALKQRLPLLGAGLFTGYTEHELERGAFVTYRSSLPASREAYWRELRCLLDFAVLGRYNYRLPGAEPLVSSRNQQLKLFSNRYCLQDFEQQRLEVSIEPDGLTQITGFPVLGSIH
jgi:anaerobic ribonucleoside-triphosphate reductase activating protein